LLLVHNGWNKGFFEGLTKLVAVRDIVKRTIMELVFYKMHQHPHYAMLSPRFETPPHFDTATEFQMAGSKMGVWGVGRRKKRASECPNFNFDELLDKNGQAVVDYPQWVVTNPFPNEELKSMGREHYLVPSFFMGERRALAGVSSRLAFMRVGRVDGNRAG